MTTVRSDLARISFERVSNPRGRQEISTSRDSFSIFEKFRETCIIHYPASLRPLVEELTPLLEPRTSVTSASKFPFRPGSNYTSEILEEILARAGVRHWRKTRFIDDASAKWRNVPDRRKRGLRSYFSTSLRIHQILTVYSRRHKLRYDMRENCYKLSRIFSRSFENRKNEEKHRESIDTSKRGEKNSRNIYISTLVTGASLNPFFPFFTYILKSAK